MIAVIQRVSEARVTVADRIVGQMGVGLLVLVTVETTDSDRDVAWMSGKLTSLRVFRQGDKHFDQDVTQVGGGILLVSNFTVAAETRRGRRPSFDRAARPESAKPLFDRLVDQVRSLGVPVQTGAFGGDMRVTLTNDGPATFILDSTFERGA